MTFERLSTASWGKNGGVASRAGFGRIASDPEWIGILVESSGVEILR